MPGSRRILLLRDEPRVGLVAEVETPAGPMIIATAHLSFVPGWNVMQLRRLVATLRRLGHPGGRAYSWATSTSPARLRASASRWRPLAAVKTFPAPRPSVQIDHALAHGPVPPVSSGMCVAALGVRSPGVGRGPAGLNRVHRRPVAFGAVAVHRLHNADWGFDSNCFVCEPRNASGLQIPFHHDDDVDSVSAEFTLDDSLSGAPRFVHGGIVLAILDEAMAWATIAVGGKFAVTKETSATFDHPVRVGRTYRVEAFVDSITDRVDGHPCQVLDDEAPPVRRSAGHVRRAVGRDRPRRRSVTSPVRTSDFYGMRRS